LKENTVIIGGQRESTMELLAHSETPPLLSVLFLAALCRLIYLALGAGHLMHAF